MRLYSQVNLRAPRIGVHQENMPLGPPEVLIRKRLRDAKANAADSRSAIP